MRFYTTPPSDIMYPYVLINPHSFDRTLSYIKYWKRFIRGIILDSGIEVFRDERIKDYPLGGEGWIKKMVRLYGTLKLLFYGTKTYDGSIVEIYATIPDYCDDYYCDDPLKQYKRECWSKPHNLWLSEEVTNIERTIMNIDYALKNFPKVNWLIPIQGHFMQPTSILKSIEYLDEKGYLDDYDYFAVANLCTTRKADTIAETLRVAKKALPNKKLHSFGIRLKAIKILYEEKLAFSVDSMAWTRPNKLADVLFLQPRGEKRRSRRNSLYSRIYFLTWLITAYRKYKIYFEDIDIDYYQEKLDAALKEAFGKDHELKKEEMEMVLGVQLY